MNVKQTVNKAGFAVGNRGKSLDGQKILEGVTTLLKKSGPISGKIPVTGSQTGKKLLMSKILTVGKTLAPGLLSMVPGGGMLAPALQMLLSTMNDDAWFKEVSAGGLPTAFPLGMRDTTFRYNCDGKVGAVSTILPAIASFRTDYYSTDSGDPHKLLLSYMMPFIRSQTRNVMIPTLASYDAVLNSSIKYLAAYYNLSKWLALGDDQPVNISNLTVDMDILRPTNYANAKAIHDKMQSFIEGNIRLPQYLVAYLRWRFGTMFLSNATERAGLISYDTAGHVLMRRAVTAADTFAHYTSAPFSGTASVISLAPTLENVIYTEQTHREFLYTNTIALSDFKLAYETQKIDFTVDARHYDEKEFILRTNLSVPDTTKDADGMSSGYRVVLDPRLSSSELLQASVISTGGVGLATTGRPFLYTPSIGVWVPRPDAIVECVNMEPFSCGIEYAEFHISSTEVERMAYAKALDLYNMGYWYEFDDTPDACKAFDMSQLAAGYTWVSADLLDSIHNITVKNLSRVISATEAKLDVPGRSTDTALADLVDTVTPSTVTPVPKIVTTQPVSTTSIKI